MTNTPPRPPTSPPPIDAAGVYITDWQCARCGFNLRGRRAADPCPACAPVVPRYAPLVQGRAANHALNTGLAWQVTAVLAAVVFGAPSCFVLTGPELMDAHRRADVTAVLSGGLFLVSGLYMARAFRLERDDTLHRLGRVLCVFLPALLIVVPAATQAWVQIAGGSAADAGVFPASVPWIRTAAVMVVLMMLGRAAKENGRIGLGVVCQLFMLVMPAAWIISHQMGTGLLASGKIMADPGMFTMIPMPTETGLKGLLLAYAVPALAGLMYVWLLIDCRTRAVAPTVAGSAPLGPLH